MVLEEKTKEKIWRPSDRATKVVISADSGEAGETEQILFKHYRVEERFRKD